MSEWVSEVAQLCLTLWDPMNCNPPGSSVHRIFQARKLEWVAISYSGGSSWPRDRNHVSCVSYIGRGILCHCVTWEALKSLYCWLFNSRQWDSHLGQYIILVEVGEENLTHTDMWLERAWSDHVAGPEDQLPGGLYHILTPSSCYRKIQWLLMHFERVAPFTQVWSQHPALGH